VKFPINKTAHFFGLSIRFRWRSRKAFLGRFGGCWNWKVGVQWSSRLILFSLLVAELTIEKRGARRAGKES